MLFIDQMTALSDSGLRLIHDRIRKDVDDNGGKPPSGSYRQGKAVEAELAKRGLSFQPIAFFA